MSSALRPGQKVTLTGTVLRPYGNEWYEIQVATGTTATMVQASALTPVVEPEPQWVPGDVVRTNGENYMLRELKCPQGFRIWCGPRGETLHVGLLSERWAEGRVEVIYKAGSDE